MCSLQFSSDSHGTTSLTNCFSFLLLFTPAAFSYEETVYGDLKELPFEELPVKEDFIFNTECEY